MQKTKRVVVGRLTKPCETCGVAVNRKASQFKAHVFCTAACYLRSEYHSQATKREMARRHPNGRVTVKCEHCGAVLSRARSQLNKRTFCSTRCRWDAAQAAQGRQTTTGGYVKVFIGKGEPGASKSGHIMEHRLVMQNHLGRTLLPAENVHHINGVRDDNRLENLELWTTSQPSGQRVADKLEWAREFVRQYEGKPVD